MTLLRIFSDRTRVSCHCGFDLILVGNDYQTCECGARLRVIHNDTWDGLILETVSANCTCNKFTPRILEILPPQEVMR